MGFREVRFTVTDEEFDDLDEAKGDRTWREASLEDIADYDAVDGDSGEDE